MTVEVTPIHTLEKMLESTQTQLANCERMIELLQPEWDKFEARDGHNLYVSRDYANHFGIARKCRNEIVALEAAVAALIKDREHD